MHQQTPWEYTVSIVCFQMWRSTSFSQCLILLWHSAMAVSMCSTFSRTLRDSFCSTCSRSCRPLISCSTPRCCSWTSGRASYTNTHSEISTERLFTERERTRRKHLSLLVRLHDLSRLLLQLLQLLRQLLHQLLVLTHLRLQLSHAVLGLLQIAATSEDNIHFRNQPTGSVQRSVSDASHRINRFTWRQNLSSWSG